MTPRSGEELTELEARQEPRLVKALEMVAPGTAVREGIDNIVHARTGGLIVIGDPAELAKANQALATLDKYRSRLDQVSTRLTALEFEGGVTLHDVLTVLQRAELVTRMAVEIERYIVELGTEGRLIEMQLEETMVGVAADKAALLQDYLSEHSEEGFALVLDSLARLPHQDLLDFGRLAEMLGYDRKVNTLDYPVSPRGYRILGR